MAASEGKFPQSPQDWKQNTFKAKNIFFNDIVMLHVPLSNAY